MRFKRIYSAEELKTCADALEFDAPESPKRTTPELGPIAKRRRIIEQRRNERAAPWQKVGRKSVCYFIGAEDDGPVKIGHTCDLLGRLEAFQLGCPVELVVLAVNNGGAAAEAEYHARFADLRLTREWFERTDEVAEEIAKLNREGDAKER